MLPENEKVLFLTFAFLVPGFVAQTLKSYFLPLRKKEGTEIILGYLTFTGINYALWSGVLYLFLFTDSFFNRPYLTAILSFAVIFVSPVLLGIVSGVLTSRGTLRKLLEKIGLQPMHQAPSGWDWKFSRREPEIIHITLDDGTGIRGLLGGNSYASQFGKDYDLYLEEVFDYQTDGSWTRDPYSSGLWVSGGVIKYIEFLKLTAKEDPSE